MTKKKTEKNTRLVALAGLSLMIVIGLVVVYVPVDQERTMYDLIQESFNHNNEPCLTESCTVPEQPICIDGINFGVCTGEPIFDQGEACFGLTTQECFDKCNDSGTQCRVF